MKDAVQTLGWWMRRTTGKTLAELKPFYEDVIGLPLVRSYGGVLILVWAGEDLIFEVKTDEHPPRDQSDAASASCIPVFRTHDLDATRARLAGHGYRPVREERSQWGRTLFYLGPDNLVTGFEARSPASPLAADREGLRKWRGGQPSRLGDLPSLPAGLHYLSRVIRRVEDVAKISAFYRDVFGLESQGREGDSELFSLGETFTLEVAPGGEAIPEPADRGELPDSYILRMHGFDAAMRRLESRGARFNGALIVWEGETFLRYVPDPEGQLVGVEERRKNSPYLEDIEAERRWADRQAGRGS